MNDERPPEISGDLHALDTVRRRVLAIGFLSITVNIVATLIWLGFGYRAENLTGKANAMFAFSGGLSLASYLVARLILAKKLWSPLWLALFLAPSIVAILWR